MGRDASSKSDSAPDRRLGGVGRRLTNQHRVWGLRRTDWMEGMSSPGFGAAEIVISQFVLQGTSVPIVANAVAVILEPIRSRPPPLNPTMLGANPQMITAETLVQILSCFLQVSTECKPIPRNHIRGRRIDSAVVTW